MQALWLSVCRRLFQASLPLPSLLQKFSILNYSEAGEAEEELLFSCMEERDGCLGIVTSTFDFDDFTYAETLVLDALANGNG